MLIKHWRKLLAASLIAGTLTFAPEIYGVQNFPVVHAEVKLYTAMGVDYGNEYESQEIVKLRARDKAIKNATKQAGVYLKTYSRSINNELTDDEVLAITSNAYEVVGEVRYNQNVKQVTDDITLIVWEATVDVNVDDSEITKWNKREDRERSTLISQTRESQTLSEENDRKVEDLRRRSQKVSDDAGRAQLKTQFEQADNEFLSNQKVEEGTRLAYQQKFDEAIKLYTEAIELKSDNAAAYNWRGNIRNAVAMNKIYAEKNVSVGEKFRKEAIDDLNRAIQLKPDYSEAYGNRGFVYYMAKDYPAAIADYNRAIELDPTNAQNYIYRSTYWTQITKDNNRALTDLNKAIELKPSAHTYRNRAGFYRTQKNFLSAIEDLTRAIELDTQDNSLALSYHGRGNCYKELKMYDKAIADYTRTIELNQEDSIALGYFGRAEVYQAMKNFGAAIDDYTKLIELPATTTSKILLPVTYYLRAQCYKALGDNAKAQADMKKYDEFKVAGGR
ncbi:MAG: tetratricopeptide repeat protein [Selenomonadaceae bacterium]|nr:tetratricopeptide repeat protein [Selenomonadaceae bacterium]